jgi:lysozyme
MTLLGIDVSHYQGDVNFYSVAQSSVKFAFAKATEGTGYIDDQFTRNWAKIQEAGLYRGAYHFGRPGCDPETQAAHFAAVVGPLGFGDLPPVLDLEAADNHDGKYVLEWALAFTKKAEALFGRKLIIYTGAFWRGKMGNPNHPFFRERLLWLAAYVAKPAVPASWDHWTFWQYTEGQHNGPAAIPGLRPCDQNRFQGTEADLDLLCSASSPPVELPLPIPTGNEWPGVHFIWPKTPAVVGPAVKLWQERVTANGFAVNSDGVYGPQSKAACMAFQREHGLAVDGIVGQRTWEATFA